MAKKATKVDLSTAFKVTAPRDVGAVKFKPGPIYRNVKPEIFEAVKDIAVNVDAE